MEEEKKYLVTPGLSNLVDNFSTHCNEYNKPILVHGDTGVGKSLFVKIFIELAKQQCKEENMPVQITHEGVCVICEQASQ